MYLITFSEMLGTNGKRIAAEVAKNLNYAFYGEEELLRAASQSGFTKELLKIEEKTPPFFERLFSEKPKIYLDRLQSVIYEVAKEGDAVFFGRGSQFLLKSFNCALHVLVTGSMKKRIERIMNENKVERETAERLIERSDRDKSGFLRFAFNEDWLNIELYDLILNTDKLSVDSAVQIVLTSARSDEIKACGIDSMKELAMLSLNRKVESVLLEAGIINPYLYVEAVDVDTLRIHGIVGTTIEKETVENVVKQIQGVKKVINDLGVSSNAFVHL